MHTYMRIWLCKSKKVLELHPYSCMQNREFKKKKRWTKTSTAALLWKRRYIQSSQLMNSLELRGHTEATQNGHEEPCRTDWFVPPHLENATACSVRRVTTKQATKIMQKYVMRWTHSHYAWPPAYNMTDRTAAKIGNTFLQKMFDMRVNI